MDKATLSLWSWTTQGPLLPKQPWLQLTMTWKMSFMATAETWMYDITQQQHCKISKKLAFLKFYCLPWHNKRRISREIWWVAAAAFQHLAFLSAHETLSLRYYVYIVLVCFASKFWCLITFKGDIQTLTLKTVVTMTIFMFTNMFTVVTYIAKLRLIEMS